ncbi:MAG: DUF1992 domain-containing protein [Dehalococcoidia bacterium]
MSYLVAVEQQILDAMRAGAFAELDGEGRPLDLSGDALADDAWLGHHLLENERLLPAWLQLGKEIEDRLTTLRELEARHKALVGELRISASPAIRSRIAGLRDRIEATARDIRQRQDQFNIDAPGRLSERPGLWVERLLERLDARVRAVDGGSGSSR